MATAVFSSKSHTNLETYCLIWLDTSVNSSKENLDAQQQLRTSINHLLTFEDDQQCLQYIHSLSNDDRVVLIVSEGLGQTIVPQIVQFRQIISIYVYCIEKKPSLQWPQSFSKVKGVLVQLDELIQQIQTDQTQRQHHKIYEGLSINIFNSSVQGEGQSSTGLNGQFIHSQLLIDCLIRMKSSADERKELITFCKQQYKDNPAVLLIIKEFERDYTSDRAIWWYTRQSFINRLLDKALLVQNIDILYLFRFFIRDLGQQLENNKCPVPIRIYRAQLMSKEEIQILNSSIGEFISMNSFLLTSINRQRARRFLSHADPSNDIEAVFFEIEANSTLDNIKPFSNITSLSYYPGEEEVLFMIGSIFRLVEMKRDNVGTWNIRMMLCSNNDQQLQTLFQHTKNELGDEEITLYKFGCLLHDMGQLDEAEKYFHHYLNQLSHDHPDISICYHALGMVTKDKGDYDSSLKWHNKSLEIFMRTSKSDQQNIANIYNSIGVVHRKKGDYTHALESYVKALTIWKKVYGEDHPIVAACLNNMAGVYQQEKKHLKALECSQKVLIIRQKHLPADHPDLGTSHNNMGILHRYLGHYDQALEHYYLALKIKSQFLPPRHSSIAMTLESIGLVYEDKNDFERALFFFDKAAIIYCHTLPPTHLNVIRIQQCITRISSKLK